MMPCMKPVWLLSIAAIALAQEPPRVTRQFDVASVKAVQPGDLPPSPVAPNQITTEPGRLRAQSVSIDALIAYAYDVQPSRIVGLKSDLGIFDVEGKAEGSYSRAELCEMLQGLLTERFGLKLHREIREMRVGRLMIGKDLKLRASELTEADPHGFTLHTSERPGFLKAKASAISLQWLTNDLSAHRSTLVVDGTGLKGLYEFDVDFEVDMAEMRDKSVPVRDAANHLWEELLSGLGLKLQNGRKERVEVLVIDRVERPEPN